MTSIATSIAPKAISFPESWISPQELSSAPLDAILTASGLIKNVCPLVREYMGHPVENALLAYKKLGIELQKIPPLPANINQILENACPIWEGKTIGETHIVTLISQTCGYLDQFEQKLKHYGEKTYGADHVLRFQYLPSVLEGWEEDFPQFSETYWALMTKEVLPNSRGESYDNQMTLVNNLSAKSGAKYAIPFAQEAFAAITLHYITTAEMLFPARSKKDDRASYTCLQTQSYRSPMFIGAFSTQPRYSGATPGIELATYDDLGARETGVAALRRL
jgi:hypothetical protein